MGQWRNAGRYLNGFMVLSKECHTHLSLGSGTTSCTCRTMTAASAPVHMHVQLTDNGALLEAVITTHPFHTVGIQGRCTAGGCDHTTPVPHCWYPRTRHAPLSPDILLSESPFSVLWG